MSITVSENFDTVTAPAIPAAWNVDAAWITSTGKFSTSPNSIYLNDSTNVKKYATLGTSSADGQNQVACKLLVRCDAGELEANTYRIGISYRGSAGTLNNSSTSYYWVYLESIPTSGDHVRFASVNNGTVSVIESAVCPAFHGAGWVEIGAYVNGSNHVIKIRRVTDSYYLNGSATWVSGEVSCMTVDDTTIASGDYCGIVASGQSQLNRLNADNFTVLTKSGMSVAAFPNIHFIRIPRDFYTEDYG